MAVRVSSHLALWHTRLVRLLDGFPVTRQVLPPWERNGSHLGVASRIRLPNGSQNDPRNHSGA
jgi:hypothetical protein